MNSCYFRSALGTLKAVIIVAVTVTIVAASPDQFAAGPVTSREIPITRFDDVVDNVLNADVTEQARFARIAIERMVLAYQAELERADLKAQTERQGDRSWHLGTRRYIERLRRIAASIVPGSAVRILREPHGPVRIVVAGEQVMLSAPRPVDQSKFERTIAENVCRISYCAGRGATVEERVAERSTRLDSGWVFGRKTAPTYSNSDGLQCTFDDRRHLKLKKSACVNIVHEIRSLSEAIVALKMHGKPIDWPYFRIDHVGPGKPQKVTYRADGTFVRMHLPSLMRAESVWRSAIPWIKASVNGRTVRYVINLPDQLIYRTSTIES